MLQVILYVSVSDLAHDWGQIATCLRTLINDVWKGYRYSVCSSAPGQDHLTECRHLSELQHFVSSLRLVDHFHKTSTDTQDRICCQLYCESRHRVVVFFSKCILESKEMKDTKFWLLWTPTKMSYCILFTHSMVSLYVILHHLMTGQDTLWLKKGWHWK